MLAEMTDRQATLTFMFKKKNKTNLIYDTHTIPLYKNNSKTRIAKQCYLEMMLTTLLEQNFPYSLAFHLEIMCSPPTQYKYTQHS